MSRAGDQKAPALPFESKELLALTAYIAHQSRGMPVAVEDDRKSKPFIDAGRAIFERRQGQLDLSCAQCHDDNWGKKLAGNLVPQASRPAIRSTAWNGRRSARCSGGCATA